jgi:hypothetical protein
MPSTLQKTLIRLIHVALLPALLLLVLIASPDQGATAQAAELGPELAPAIDLPAETLLAGVDLANWRCLGYGYGYGYCGYYPYSYYGYWSSPYFGYGWYPYYSYWSYYPAYPYLYF